MIRSFNTAIMADSTFRRLSLLARFLYMALYNHPQNHFCGLFQLSVEEMAAHVRASDNDVRDALSELVKSRWVELDLELDLVWVPAMRDVLGGKVSAAQQESARKYLESLRHSPLVHRVAVSLGITPKAVPAEVGSLGRVPGRVTRTLPQVVPQTVGGTSLSVSVSGSDSVSGEEPARPGAVWKPGAPAADRGLSELLAVWPEFKRRAFTALGVDARTARQLDSMNFLLPNPAHTLLIERWAEQHAAGAEGADLLVLADWIAAGHLSRIHTDRPGWLVARLAQSLSDARVWDEAGRPDPRARGSPQSRASGLVDERNAKDEAERRRTATRRLLGGEP